MVSPAPTFSIILTTYNGEQFVLDALDSIKNQTYDDYELIVSDDGSDDSTPQLVDEHSLNPSVFIEREDNVGIARNTNTAVSKAKGDYLAFLDQDDIWQPKKLANHAKAHQDQSADIIYSDVIEWETTQDTPSRINSPEPYPAGDQFLLQLLDKHNFVQTMSAVSISRRVWEEHGGFDEYLQLACDYDLWFRLGESHDFSHLSLPLVEKREHTNNVSSDIRVDHSEIMYILDKLEWNHTQIEADILEKRINYHFIAAWRLYQEGAQSSALSYCLQSIQEGGPFKLKDQGLNPYLLIAMLALDSLSGNKKVGGRIYRLLRS